MKTNEELNALRNEVEAMDEKLAELTEDELKLVMGGLFNMPEIKRDEHYVMTINGNDCEDCFKKPTNDNRYEIHFYTINKDDKK